LDHNLFGSYLKLHFVVLIYGFTAILGKLINLPATQLVWYRMFIAALSFILLFRINRVDFRLSRPDLFRILFVGVIVALHWITFFGAIKLSNISVTLGCLASTTLFASILEPIFLKKKVSVLEVFIGLFIIVGLYLIFQFETRYTIGIIVALISAFLGCLFTVLNKKLIIKHNASVISFYEMLGGFGVITIYMIASGELPDELKLPSNIDIFYLLLLGVVCTAYAFAVNVKVMERLSAYVVTLSINLEPVYGIILAYIFFKDSELMTPGFYAGTVIILLSVLGYPVLKRVRKRKAVMGKL
jgi:drug/metabolite transporter (DMT)-like permease